MNPPRSACDVQVRDLRFCYADSTFGMALRELRLSAGETLAILGPSGCGKSTLLRLLAGLLRPDEGVVQIGSSNIHALGKEAQRSFRLRHIGLVFQDFALLDYLTVGENILLPMRLGSFSNEGAVARAQSLMDHLGIRPHENKLTRKLSQGERQRVAIARALAHKPGLVLADEPTASLDAARRDTVVEMLVSYAKEHGSPLIMVTHDASLKHRFDRVVDFQDLVS